MRGPVAVLLYPGCLFFEVALAAEVLAAHGPVRGYTPDGRPHRSSMGLTLEADGDYAALAAAPAAVVLVPGGDPGSILLPQPRSNAALQACAQAGAVLAGICAGNLVLAAAGLLRGRRATHNYTAELAPPEKVVATASYWEGLIYEPAPVVRDGRVITAQPWAYRAYAAEVARAAGVLDDAAAQQLRDAGQERARS